MTLLYLAVTTFALCYLAADARIFGVDTTAWNEVYLAQDYDDMEAWNRDVDWVWGLGVLKFRQHALYYNTIREHLSCYFCMGIWAGPLAHLILRTLFAMNNTTYHLSHPNTVEGWAFGLGCAFLWGAVGSYSINVVFHKLEQ